jgi:hypothetical protein
MKYFTMPDFVESATQRLPHDDFRRAHDNFGRPDDHRWRSHDHVVMMFISRVSVPSVARDNAAGGGEESYNAA